jgi:PAS domain-containing protein
MPAMEDPQKKQTLSELLVLRKAVEASGEVIFMTDSEGIITYINPEFTRLYGYSGEKRRITSDSGRIC